MNVIFGESSANFWKAILLPAFSETLQMLIITTVIATLFGLIIALILNITRKDGVRPNKYIHKTLALIVNSIRSFPFMILMVVLLPLTKALVGASYGVKAAIVPLTVSSTAFIAVIIDNAMQEVDSSLIEAMRSTGINDFQLITGVILSEAVPSIVSGVILATITILGGTAMAGALGAGGIGAAALTYGYQSFNYEVMYTVSLILIIFVQIIQSVGNKIYNRLK